MSTYVFKQKKGPLNVEVSHMSSKKQAIENFSGLLPSDVSIDDFDVFKKTPCPYCRSTDSKPVYADGYNAIIVFSDGTIGVEHSDGNPGGYSSDWSNPGTIHYCPMCGRPLNEKEE